MVVTKKDGGVRFCVAYRKLNKVTRFDTYPMPRIEELIDTVVLQKSYLPWIWQRLLADTNGQRVQRQDSIYNSVWAV